MKCFANDTLPDVVIDVPDATDPAHYQRMGWHEVDSPATRATPPAVADTPPPVEPPPGGVDLTKPPADGPELSAEPPGPGHAEGDPA